MSASSTFSCPSGFTFSYTLQITPLGSTTKVGCDQILIISGRGKQAIEDHFDVSYELERMLEERSKTDLLIIVRNISDMIHVAYVRQKEALGAGSLVLIFPHATGNGITPLQPGVNIEYVTGLQDTTYP